MASAAIAIRVPCELSIIVDPRRVAASLESCNALYIKSLLFIIPNVTTAGNFATNLLAKYRGNIVASNSFQQQCCLVYDGLNNFLLCCGEPKHSYILESRCMCDGRNLMKALKCKPLVQFTNHYSINVLSKCSNIISH